MRSESVRRLGSHTPAARARDCRFRDAGKQSPRDAAPHQERRPRQLTKPMMMMICCICP
jgi:hypothetical protein